MGDVIEFIATRQVVARRRKVLVHCAPDLRGVIETVEGLSGIFHAGERPRSFPRLASLRDFPDDAQTIPAKFLTSAPDPARVARWKNASRPHRVSKSALSGRHAAHQGDCAIEQAGGFRPLAMEGVTLFSLQKGKPESQLTNPPSGMQITPLGQELRSFADTAALLDCLDLLISVDTSVVHIVGALGRPVWTLLAKGPDWRWMLDREDSPWYPTMKLFRQREMGDWSEVMQRVSANLRQLVRL
jgi:hypothetical protein